MSMHVIVRWLLRNVLLLFPEEWGKARQDMQAMQAVHKIQALCNAELHIFRSALTDLERLHTEAARAITRFPAAQGLIVEMLEQRMQQLAHTVNDNAAQKDKAA
jgi:hypothetical protein